MNCKTARHWMQLELDGELPARRAAALAGHLEGCRACTQIREQLWTLRSAIRELTDATGGGPGWHAQAQRGHVSPFERENMPAPEYGLRHATRARFWRTSLRPRRFAWAVGLAAAAVITIVIGIWFARLPAANGPARHMIVEGPEPSRPDGTAIIPPATPEPQPQPSIGSRPLVRVEFGSPENLIAVPYQTRNPNVTIIWLYPAVRGEQAVRTPETQPPTAKGASS